MRSGASTLSSLAESFGAVVAGGRAKHAGSDSELRRVSQKRLYSIVGRVEAHSLAIAHLASRPEFQRVCLLAM